MLKSLLGSTTAKITAVLFAAAIATGGLAATGALSFQTVATTAGAGHSSEDVSGTVSDDPTSTVTATVGEDHESVTATTSEHSDDGATETVTSTVTPTVHESESPDVSETAGGPNHGHCVSFAAQNAQKMGLTGSQMGMFVSMVARDGSAVSAEVSGSAVPDSKCVTAMTAAKAAVMAAGVTGTSHDGSGGASSQDGSKRDGHSGRSGGSDGGSATTSGNSGSGGRG